MSLETTRSIVLAARGMVQEARKEIQNSLGGGEITPAQANELVELITKPRTTPVQDSLDTYVVTLVPDKRSSRYHYSITLGIETKAEVQAQNVGQALAVAAHLYQYYNLEPMKAKVVLDRG